IAGKEQMHERDRASIERQDREDEPDCEQRLDHASRIHPYRRWIELGRLEEAERLRHEKFRVDVRNEEQPADQPQDGELIGEVEALRETVHFSPGSALDRSCFSLARAGAVE